MTTSPTRPWTRHLPAAATLAFAGALAALVVGPSLGDGALVGHPTLDVWAHAWGADWFAHSLASGRFPWRVTGAAHPLERVLWYIDPLGAVLGAPLRLLAGPVVGWNAQLLLQVFLAGLGGVAWGRALGGRGWLAGAALASAPFLQGELWNGVSESCWVGLVALAGAGAARRSWLTGLWVGLAATATPYLAVSAGLLAATVLVVGEGSGDPPAVRDRLLRGAVALGVALLVAAPHLWLLTESLAATDSFVMRPLRFDGFNQAVLRSNATDPVALLHPGGFWSVPFRGDAWSVAWRRTPYLGLALLVGGLASLVRNPRGAWLLVPVVLGAVACLGPFLWHDGGFVATADGGQYRLPMWWVAHASPVSFDHPMRFVVLPVVALAGLADRAVGRWALLAVPLVLVEHLALAPTSWPVATAPGDLPGVYDALPADGRGVVDLPAEAGTGNWTNAHLYRQRLHGRPVPYSNKVGAMGIPWDNAAARTWAALSKRGGGYVEGVDPNADLDAAVRALADAGYGWVVLHPDLLVLPQDRPHHVSAVSRQLGPPREVEGALVWEIPAP